MTQRKSVICCGEENILRHVSRILGGHFIVHGLRTVPLALTRLQNEPEVHAFIAEQVTSAEQAFDALKATRDLRPAARRVLLTEYGDLTGIIGGLHSGIIQHLVQLPIRDAELLAAVCPVIPQSVGSGAHSFA